MVSTIVNDNSISPIYEALSCTTILGQSVPGSNGSEGYSMFPKGPGHYVGCLTLL